MRIVLMGMPGVGKGTQAARLSARLGVPHVSTGDILREAVRAGSPLGSRVRSCLDAGDLVPDELMGDLIAERLAAEDTRPGFILDGFPRTVEQVTILDRVQRDLGVELDGLFLLVAPESEILRRLSGRRICASCGAVYQLGSHPPRTDGVCDDCGAALVQRPDDAEDVVLDRLRVYREQTLPVAEAYRRRGLLQEVDGAGKLDEVEARLSSGVENAREKRLERG